MGIFYTTLLYFFIFLILNRLKYIEIGKSLSDMPIFVLILGILIYLFLSLINIIINRKKGKYKIKFQLGYPQDVQGKLIINIGAGILPMLALVYLYPRAALIPFLISISICLSICLVIYHSKKNVKNELPVFISFLISVACALLLTPANPIFLMLAVFAAGNLFLLLSNIIFLKIKTPLYIGEKNFFHVFFILILIALIF